MILAEVRRHAELRNKNAVHESVSEASRRTVVRIRPARFFGSSPVLFTTRDAQNDAGRYGGDPPPTPSHGGGKAKPPPEEGDQGGGQRILIALPQFLIFNF